MKRTFFITCVLFNCFALTTSGQTDSLRQKIKQILSPAKADIGVAIYGFENEDSLSFNGNTHFPMQSVFKFHIALAVLNKTDKEELSLDQKIFIKKSDLVTRTWSPLQKKYPDGNVSLPLREIISYMVSQSDNNACDILLRLLGGTLEVDKYFHDIAINDVSIQASEEEMHKEWNIQFKNWTTPLSGIHLLRKFYDREILSEKTFNFLWGLMSETSTGKSRIKGELPAGALVADKTGTSDTNESGVTAAVNDIGIVTMPNGKHFAICVFVSNSREDNNTNEKIIADIARAAWDYFTLK